MENPFKKILEHQEVPKVLKEKVLGDVAKIKLAIDMADLFVVKYPNTMGSLLTLREEKEDKKPKKK
ncbi:MAG: hypothetical protein HWD85_07310 [Flavobacteriaceae bacterium]|nr:hypothetical protein [Flavobacteriaceae bacterium]